MPTNESRTPGQQKDESEQPLTITKDDVRDLGTREAGGEEDVKGGIGPVRSMILSIVQGSVQQ